MYQESPNNHVDNINKRKTIRYRHQSKEQKRPNLLINKTINLKTKNIIKITKIKEPTIKENIFEVKIRIKTKKKIIIRKTKIGIKKKEKIRITIFIETITI